VLPEIVEPREGTSLRTLGTVGLELGRSRAQIRGAEEPAIGRALAVVEFEPGHGAADVTAAGHRGHVVEAIEAAIVRLGRRIPGSLVQKGLDHTERERRRAYAATGDRERRPAGKREIALRARQVESLAFAPQKVVEDLDIFALGLEGIAGTRHTPFQNCASSNSVSRSQGSGGFTCRARCPTV
jgi:hypothetical protein